MEIKVRYNKPIQKKGGKNMAVLNRYNNNEIVSFSANRCVFKSAFHGRFHIIFNF